ncbi:MAG: DUF721 domain-containing protein [Novosphingobium sp.]
MAARERHEHGNHSTGREHRGNVRRMEDEGGFGKPRDRDGEARSIGDLLRGAAAPAFRRMGFGRSDLVARWREIVGPALAAHSTPITIRYAPGRKSSGVLDISADLSHAPALRDAGPEIIEQINSLFGYPAVAHINIKPRR